MVRADTQGQTWKCLDDNVFVFVRGMAGFPF